MSLTGTYTAEELTDFNKYLSTLTFQETEDLLTFCVHYSNYRFTCPEEKRLEASAKYVCVMSFFGNDLLKIITEKVYGKQDSSQ